MQILSNFNLFLVVIVDLDYIVEPKKGNKRETKSISSLISNKGNTFRIASIQFLRKLSLPIVNLNSLNLYKILIKFWKQWNKPSKYRK